MLTISTLSEALDQLKKATGREWTDSEIFDVATTHGIKLSAAAPITSQVILEKFIVGEGLKTKPIRAPGGVALALLYPWQIGQLWISGETLARSPDNRDLPEPEENEYILFKEDIRVTRESVRIRDYALQRILKVWQDAQAGRWIEDKSSPDGMRYQRGPSWMFPPEPVATATPATPATQQEESKRGLTKQRIIGAFEGLYFQTAAQWDKALANIPDWLEPGVVMKGKRGNNKQSTLWDPVQIAIALLDKKISIKKLDAVFVGLGDWADEWRAKSDYFR